MFKKKDKEKEKKDPVDPKNSDQMHNLSKDKNLNYSQQTEDILSKSSTGNPLSGHSNISSNHSTIVINSQANPIPQPQLNSSSNPTSLSNISTPDTNTSTKLHEENLKSNVDAISNKSSQHTVSHPDSQLSLSEKGIQKEGETEAEIQQLLLSIVSGFSEYFYTVATTVFGSRPKKIAFNSIRSDRKIGTTGIELVSVNFSCELGQAHAGLAVKIHKNTTEVLQIVENINYLVQRLESYRFLGVSTPKIIFQKGPILVLEGISGESFRHSPVPITEKFRLAGKCLAELCVSHQHIANTNLYRMLEKQVLEALPIDENFKQMIAK